MTLSYQVIDVPFEYRHTCWFCGEPYYESHSFMASPNYDQQTLPILVPCCQECFSLCKSIKVSGLDILRDKVKEQLHRKYEKHLQIGINWTKEELEDCEFEGKALEGFKESAWAMYEIAKGRVNYAGWPLAIDGQPMASFSSAFHVQFDGVTYTSLQHAVEQLAKAYAIPQPYLEEVIEVVGREKLAYAIRFAKTTYGYSAQERMASIASLRALLAEEQALSMPMTTPSSGIDVPLADIREFILHRTVMPAVATQWLFKHGVTTLQQLADQEDAFFAHFGQDSEFTAFTYFNAMQIYLEQRELDMQWAKEHDPNQAWFAKL
ncbi:hypothetical protein ACFFLZ_14175 [Photobacterium aphoticum]|uniref:Uncharacterized protein n=1 Tax=Photobacterium aphoticum TaxID=754436 RepID=A0A0J1GLG6_9GAMM|nr:hypothetical protein [Photobacterium aphoticum]KLV00461.1 hypothetical protein ABT58_12430 [Photobacterium aphoticum]PSU59808.1 hypothetical protein C9I90_02260 [Photobacterium aphoticum]GHA42148.1 hypothetical protein GCM10007086_14670 [Photobacterium aphoticum]